MENLPFGVLAALAGLFGGLALGLAARLGDFCTLGALESALYGQDQKRMRLWGIVLGVAVLLTQVAWLAGYARIEASMYHAFAWAPLASVVGGLVFGYGMALAGNCGFGSLVRFGGGDLRALVIVVVMGIFGFATLSGPLAPLRVALFPQPEAAGPQGIIHDITGIVPLPPLVIILVIAAALVAWALAYEPLRRRPGMIAWGLVAGVAIAWGFIATSYVNDISFGEVAVEGASFTAPVGRTLIYLMTATAGGINFSVGSVIGVIAGAFLGSVWRGLFRWEACEDPRELGRQVGGAALMGIGGVIAMGCSIGQGASGIATLAWSGPVTLAAILVGGTFGLRRLIMGYERV